MNVPRFFPLAVAAACLLCGGLARAEAPIETATVTRVAVAARHVAEGVVEAVSAATLGAQVPGRIVDVKVDAGDPVTRGQVLMRIDASAAEQSVAVAAANVASASAALANARAEWQRTEALFAQKYISQARVDQARAALRAAEAGYRAAQAGRGEAVVAREVRRSCTTSTSAAATPKAPQRAASAPGSRVWLTTKTTGTSASSSV